MSDESRTDVTRLLLELRLQGANQNAIREQLYAAVYGELRRAAGVIMRAEDPGHILQPTALVNEAYIKLVNNSRIEWKDRIHFLAVATRAMRQVLVEYARQRDSLKRGGALKRVTLDEAVAISEHRTLEIIALDTAIARLSSLSDRMAQIAELRVFGGMTHDEIADALDISKRTVASDWSVARRWLIRELTGTTPATEEGAA